MTLKIYHHPRCSKSRKALSLIKNKTSEFKIVEYLKYPLKFREIKLLLSQLSMKPIELVRVKEPIWKTNYKGKKMRDNEIINTHKNQMANTVRWTESIKKLEEISETNIIEIGPNKILSGLIKRISNKFDIKSINTISDIK